MKIQKKQKIDLVNPEWEWGDGIFPPSLAEGKEGFIYIIEHLPTGKRYLGKKYFWSIRKVAGKTKRQRKESDWRSYWSSSDLIKEMIEADGGTHNFKRRIISLHATRGDTNYSEVKWQFHFNVLEDDQWMNDAIHRWRNISKRIISERMYSD